MSKRKSKKRRAKLSARVRAVLATIVFVGAMAALMNDATNLYDKFFLNSANMPKETTNVSRVEMAVNSLADSARSFDNGDRAAPAKIAVSLKTLLYDFGQNKSLLSEANVIKQMQFCNSQSYDRVGNWMPFMGLVSTTWHPGVKAQFIPRIGTFAAKYKLPYQPFELWWNLKIFDDRCGNQLSRKDIVLAEALLSSNENMFDFAPEDYSRVSKNLGYRSHFNKNSFSMVSVKVGGGCPDDNKPKDMLDSKETVGSVASVAIRAIAEEVIVSFLRFTRQN